MRRIWWYVIGIGSAVFVGAVVMTIYFLFFYLPEPVVIAQPIPVEVMDNDTLIMYGVYTRTVSVPVTIYAQYINQENGRVITLEPLDSPGGQVGDNIAVEIPAPLPSDMPPGEYVRCSRGRYDIFGNGLVVRFVDWCTDVFVVE